MLHFAKKYWFYICIVILLLIGYFRNSFQFEVGLSPKPNKERFIDGQAGASESPSFFGLLGSKPGAHKMPEIDTETTKAFLLRFGKVTQGEQEKFGIPASALLACAYVNSFGGNRAIAKESNNFFAMPCGSGWTGPHVTTDDQCYRQYETAWASFRDGSQSMSQQEWAKAAIASKNKEWKKWVILLAKNGCSDIADAEANMIKIIKSYRLYELDQKG